ncbi:hypothetical protein C8F01DRAFT_1103966, partial [Mycena amicta]
MSFPESGHYLESIRASAAAATRNAGVVVNEAAIARLVASSAFQSSFDRLAAADNMAMPLLFPSAAAELCFFGLLAILNFGSGFRVPLHKATGGRGASNTMKALALGMYISDEGLMTAHGMQNISQAKIAELMNVKLHIERPHETLPVVVGELGGPMYDLVKLVTGTLNETGDILVNKGYSDLGVFIAQVLQTAQTNVDVILEHLVRTFPAFQDMAVVDGQQIFCFKKALFLIHAISVRFPSAPFPLPSVSVNLPILTDNVVPSLLVHLGVIDLSGSAPLASIPLHAASPERLQTLLATAAPGSIAPIAVSPGPVVSSNQAFILRAAAIDACERIVEAAKAAGMDGCDKHEAGPVDLEGREGQERTTGSWSDSNCRGDSVLL